MLVGIIVEISTQITHRTSRLHVIMAELPHLVNLAQNVLLLLPFLNIIHWALLTFLFSDILFLGRAPDVPLYLGLRSIFIPRPHVAHLEIMSHILTGFAGHALFMCIEGRVFIIAFLMPWRRYKLAESHRLCIFWWIWWKLPQRNWSHSILWEIKLLTLLLLIFQFHTGGEIQCKMTEYVCHNWNSYNYQIWPKKGVAS